MKAFKLRLHKDQAFEFHLYHIPDIMAKTFKLLFIVQIKAFRLRLTDIQTLSSTDQAFRLWFQMDKKYGLCLYHIPYIVSQTFKIDFLQIKEFILLLADIHISSSKNQSFKPCLHMDQTYRLHLHHISHITAQTLKLRLLQIKLFKLHLRVLLPTHVL